MGKSLLFKLSLALFAGLFCAFGLTLAMRVFVELPALYALEQSSDAKDVERVRRAFQLAYDNLIETAASTGAWDVAYEFVTLTKDDPRFAKYIEETHGWAYHEFTQTHGWKYLAKDGTEIFRSHYNLQTGQPELSRDLDLNSVARAFREAEERIDGSNSLAVGLTQSNLGPILLVVADILPSQIDEAVSRGQLIIWREFDAAKAADISEATQTELEFTPVSDIDTAVASMYEATTPISDESFVPRGNGRHLYWWLRDADGSPLFLVKQSTSPRLFDDALISTSLVGQFLAAALVLLPFALYFLRNVVFRVKSAQRVMQEIGSSGDLTLRLQGDRPDGDELDRMLHHFNELLGRVEDQEKELRSSNKKLEQENEHDSLTGINNRRFFERYLQMASYTCGRMRRDLAIAMIDIDCFKAYNDNYGHQAGDEAIRKVAQTLSDNLARLTDCVARYGGEEFVVLLLDTPLDNAVDIAERLRLGVESLQMPHEHADHSDVVTVSIGVAAWSPRAEDAATLIVEAADQALYTAKSAGRNRIYAIPDPDEVIRADG